MITLVDQPLIQYVVQEAVSAGFTDIILVTHSSKQAIENHFDHNFELEVSLARKNKVALIEKLKAIIPPHINIISVRQPEPLGLGHAVLCAAPVIGGEHFAVIFTRCHLKHWFKRSKNRWSRHSQKAIKAKSWLKKVRKTR